MAVAAACIRWRRVMAYSEHESRTIIYSLMSTLQEGAAAPPVEATTDSGGTFRLADRKGKSVVLYFYPKADTPGCTTEACEFRDAIEEFRGINAEIVGVSPDAPKALTKFKEKFSLP